MRFIVFGENWVTMDYGDGMLFGTLKRVVKFPSTTPIENLISQATGFYEVSAEDMESIEMATKFAASQQTATAVACDDGELAVGEDLKLEVSKGLSFRLNPKFLSVGLSLGCTINTPNEKDPTVIKGGKTSVMIAPMR